MPKVEIHNMEQGSPEWNAIRLGRMTGSNAQRIGVCGKGLETYALELTAEILTGKAKDGFNNEHMERGHELEAEARAMYEIETGNIVTEAGFVTYGDDIGVSPDGCVLEHNGGIEIKSPSDKVFLQFLLDGKIDTKYLWQIQKQILVMGWKWCDYVLYNPNFENSLIITRVLPDEKKHGKVQTGWKMCRGIVKDNLKKIKERK